ncbi:EAL domain-containing protein [Niveibacterium umoris]|uniref:Diguanylate cyclase (GGDEF)-like protein/PAS domain S-box-containing protein n=1 Tax=Niveibacterium umoris TaxID=1193620 RepID=A0A840BLX3_9RHOO|nr:EAL domain-containing protein [Niveibacterium umoris]MBB4012529.1 diguanylate cyclase (GGDEF)-like protein/PAS domain S-box-containing protein [Niveibacterium umoris]
MSIARVATLLTLSGISLLAEAGEAGGAATSGWFWLALFSTLATVAAAGLALAMRRRATDMSQLRDEARVEAERIRKTIEGTNAVSWEFDPASGLCTHVSRQAELLLGFPLSAWSQPGFWRENLHPEDRSFVVEFFRAQTELGFDHELEYRMLHADGQTVFVRDMRTVHRKRDGTIDRISSLLINLSVHKATEAALEDSEARFRSTFEQAAVGMAMCSLAGRFTRVNRRFSEITGYSEADLLQSEVREVADADEVGRFDAQLALLADGEREVVTHEMRIRRRDGLSVWVAVSVSVVRALSREPSQYMVVIEDISGRKQAEAVLRESEARLRTIVATLDEGIVMRSAAGDVVFANDAVAAIYGMTPAQFASFRLESGQVTYVYADGSTRSPESLPPMQALKLRESVTDMIAFRLADGSVRSLSVNSTPLLREEDGSAYAVVSTVTDMTDRQRAEAELRLAASVFDNSVEAIVVADAERHILRANRAFALVTGFDTQEVVGRDLPDVTGSRHETGFFEGVWRTIEREGFWQGEVWNTRKNGKAFPEWLSVSAVRDAEKRISHYVAVFADITERKANEARIAYLAHHDPLTGLPNRALMQDRLQQSLARAHRERRMVGLLFLDLDRFKMVNDSLGHQAGDRLLQQVAERVRTCVRDSDTICRQGGDEFIIVLNDIQSTRAPARVAEKILNALTEPFDVDTHRIGTSFSIGIAVYPNDGRDAESLMKNADTAMYHAKESGRNTFRFFTEAMNANALERLQLENALRQAVERNELTLYYQPQVSLRDGTVVGAEALLRWQHPQRGFVSPARFIPIAEESGLIVPLGRWVLREACRQARAWERQGLPPIMMAVNISPLQFRRDNIVEMVRQVLTETGHEPDRVELELTESLLMENAGEVLTTIQQLKSIGVRLSIDDFGTGYSSLSYLKRFAVDRLKIDQSFVRDVPHDSDDAAIVRAIIQLGEALKLDVIAEGAETIAQVEFLRREGCAEAQGYYWCPPVPPGVFESMLHRGTITPEADQPLLAAGSGLFAAAVAERS